VALDPVISDPTRSAFHAFLDTQAAEADRRGWHAQADTRGRRPAVERSARAGPDVRAAAAGTVDRSMGPRQAHPFPLYLGLRGAGLRAIGAESAGAVLRLVAAGSVAAV